MGFNRLSLGAQMPRRPGLPESWLQVGLGAEPDGWESGHPQIGLCIVPTQSGPESPAVCTRQEMPALSQTLLALTAVITEGAGLSAPPGILKQQYGNKHITMLLMLRVEI